MEAKEVSTLSNCSKSMAEEAPPRTQANVIILTSGLSGSSVLAGLIARSGYWTGETTVKKEYDTYENSNLVKLNVKLLAEANYTGNYALEFSPETIRTVAALSGRIDTTAYRRFIDHCEKYGPWIWKDPRLWITVRFWYDLLPLKHCKFVLLTRDLTHAWVSCTLRKQIQTYRHLRLYEHSIEESIRSFFSTCGLSFVHLKYEKLIRRPEQSIDKLNGYLGTDLTVRDLSSVYRGPLHQTPRNSPVDYAKAVLIYVKNYSERIDIDRRRVAPANHPEVRPIPQVAVPGDRPITEEIENPATSRINAAGGKPAIETANEGFTLWLTGLSGAGKSTISNLLAERLRAQRRKVEILDGDVVRTRLSKGLGFTKDDRDENIRRIGFVCDLLARNGVIAIAAAISPYRCLRDEIRARVKNFIEVYVNCPIDVLAARDVKGLYQRALAGTLANFTGVSDPYEPPVAPEVEVNSSIQTPEESVDQIWAVLQKRCLI